MTDQRTEFIARARESLDVISANMAKVEVRVRKANGDVRRSLKRRLETMRQAKNEAERKLEAASFTSQRAWRDFEQDVEEAKMAFADAVERTAERLQ